MAKKKAEEPQTTAKPKKILKKYVLRDDYPPKKKGETIELSEGGAKLLKSLNKI